MGLPPFPDQTSANILTNGGFETGDFTDWTSVNGCWSVVSDEVHSGSYSAKATACNGVVMYKNYTVTARQGLHLRVSAWVKSSADYDAVEGDNQLGYLYLSQTNVTRGSAGLDGHGQVTRKGFTMYLGSIQPGQGWQYHDTEIVIPAETYGDTFRMSLGITSQTAGSLWIDDIAIEESWTPLRTFMMYPNYKGMLWDDVDSWQCSEYGTAEICGVSEISPRAGETLSDYKLIVELDMTAGCASPIATDSTNPVSSATTYWNFDGSGLTLDQPYYVCTELQLVSDSSPVAAYNDWLLYPRDPTYRASLTNYIDHRGRWFNGGVARWLYGPFAAFSSASCSGCVYTTAADWINKIRGYSVAGLPRSTYNATKASTFAHDNLRARHNTILMWADGVAGGSPTAIQSLLDGWESLGLHHIHLRNVEQGYVVTGTNTPAAPDPPSVASSSTGGNIGAVNVWVKTSAAVFLIEGEILANWRQSGVSSADSTGVLTGSTNKVTVTLPACINEIHRGWYIYAATSNDENEPDAANFKRQYSGGPVACDPDSTTDVILTAISAGGHPAPTSDDTIARYYPGWASGMTNEQLWAAIGDVMYDEPAAAATYLCDECTAMAIGYNYLINKYLRENYPGLPSFGISGFYPAGNLYFRDVFDVPSGDPYGYYASFSTLEHYHTNNHARTATMYGANNTTVQLNSANVVRVAISVDELARLVYGSRPQWTAIQQYEKVSSWRGFPYAELRREAWQAIVAQQNYGSIGGLLKWGWVDGGGLELNVWTHKVTKEFEDDLRLGAELMNIEEVLLADPRDSTHLGTGVVVSSVGSSISLPTSTCVGWPSPVRFVTKQMDDGTQWIFATNLCADAQTVTFTLANPPPSAVVTKYPSGEKMTLSEGAFSDSSWSDYNVEIYRIETPKGVRTRPN